MSNWRDDISAIADKFGVAVSGNWRNDLAAIRKYVEAGGGGGGGTTNHAALENLGYAASNHTGFQAALSVGQLQNIADVTTLAQSVERLQQDVKDLTTNVNSKESISSTITLTGAEAAALELLNNTKYTVVDALTSLNIVSVTGAGSLTFVAGESMTVSFPSTAAWPGYSEKEEGSRHPEFTAGLVYNVSYFDNVLYADGGR